MKITGRDVLATWKLMVALILVPVTYFSYSVTAALVGYYVYHQTVAQCLQLYLLAMTFIVTVSYIGIMTGETLNNNMK